MSVRRQICIGGAAQGRLEDESAPEEAPVSVISTGRRAIPAYLPGEEVLVYGPETSNKLLCSWQGPFLIKGVRHPDRPFAYRLHDPRGIIQRVRKRLLRAHVSRLKRYFGPSESADPSRLLFQLQSDDGQQCHWMGETGGPPATTTESGTDSSPTTSRISSFMVAAALLSFLCSSRRTLSSQRRRQTFLQSALGEFHMKLASAAHPQPA